MNPTGRITVTTESHAVTRFQMYGFGEDVRVPNEGALLLVSENYLSDAGKVEKVSTELLLRGRDLWMFDEKLQQCLALYAANADYLSQPATREVKAAPSSRIASMLEQISQRDRSSAAPSLHVSREDHPARNR